MKQVNLRIYKAILPLLMGLFFSLGAYAQLISVKGHVKDAVGEPVIGANIIVKGTTNGTITDFDGNFTLNAPKGSILSISYIGYKSTEVAAAPSLTVTLKDDSQVLNDVVVIGYGSVKKSDLSGSVVAIKAEEMNRGAVTSPQELIQGKVPGLFVAPGNGQPGAGSTIRIRGGASLNASNDPLIVIDGIPTSNDAAPGTPNALATINPNDIETFTVLKDASATAIYGSRASNGVIIITTKKGSQGKVKITYSGSFAAKDPYQRVPTLGADEFRSTLLGQYAEGTAQGNAVRNILNVYPNQSTNWQDAIYQTGLSTDQNIAVSGKAGFLPYRVSFGYTNERGTLKTASYERYTGAINLSPKFFNDHLSVDINVKGTINNNRFADAGAVGAAAFFDPTKPMYTDNGKYNGYWNWSEVPGAVQSVATWNPLSLLYDRDNHGKTKRSLGNIQLDYKIHGLEDLHANLNLGYDVAKTTGSNFMAPGSVQSIQDTNFPSLGNGNTWNSLRRNHLLDFYLNYTKDIESIKSHIDVMAGYSWQHFYNSTTNSYPYSAAYAEKTGEEFYKKGDDYASESYLVSFFGRLNYTLLNRYLVTFTLRNDGSSRFSPDNRWGLFPSVALAWKLNEESFLKNVNAISDLKLRLGYGVTGQQNLGNGDYPYMARYMYSKAGANYYFGDTEYSLIAPQPYDQNLKWEETTTWNVGIDYGFLNGRITGTIDYYFRKTKDLLNTVTAPAGTNFSNQLLTNVGTLENKGFEFSINAHAVSTQDWNWNIGYNISYNKNKITKMTFNDDPNYAGVIHGGIDGGTGYNALIHRVGEAFNSFYVFEQIYGPDGKPIEGAYVDQNGDNQINDADLICFKKAAPDVFMGLTSQLSYKNWDFSFALRGSFGNYVYNNVQSNREAYEGANMYDQTGFLKNRLTSARSTDFKNAQYRSSYYVQNASFVRMDNISLGYTFNKLFNDKQSARVYATVQNPFVITKYKGLDPEISGEGIDNNIYPRPRVFMIGLNLNF